MAEPVGLPGSILEIAKAAVAVVKISTALKTIAHDFSEARSDILSLVLEIEIFADVMEYSTAALKDHMNRYNRSPLAEFLKDRDLVQKLSAQVAQTNISIEKAWKASESIQSRSSIVTKMRWLLRKNIVKELHPKIVSVKLSLLIVFTAVKIEALVLEKSSMSNDKYESEIAQLKSQIKIYTEHIQLLQEISRKSEPKEDRPRRDGVDERKKVTKKRESRVAKPNRSAPFESNKFEIRTPQQDLASLSKSLIENTSVPPISRENLVSRGKELDPKKQNGEDNGSLPPAQRGGTISTEAYHLPHCPRHGRGRCSYHATDVQNHSADHCPLHCSEEMGLEFPRPHSPQRKEVDTSPGVHPYYGRDLAVIEPSRANDDYSRFYDDGYSRRGYMLGDGTVVTGSRIPDGDGYSRGGYNDGRSYEAGYYEGHPYHDKPYEGQSYEGHYHGGQRYQGNPDEEHSYNRLDSEHYEGYDHHDSERYPTLDHQHSDRSAAYDYPHEHNDEKPEIPAKVLEPDSELQDTDIMYIVGKRARSKDRSSLDERERQNVSSPSSPRNSSTESTVNEASKKDIPGSIQDTAPDLDPIPFYPVRREFGTLYRDLSDSPKFLSGLASPQDLLLRSDFDIEKKLPFLIPHKFTKLNVRKEWIETQGSVPPPKKAKLQVLWKLLLFGSEDCMGIEMDHGSSTGFEYLVTCRLLPEDTQTYIEFAEFTGEPLKELYNEAGDGARVDIIAVHGLSPGRKNDSDQALDTWRKPSGPKGRLWLRDDLPRFVPQSRIFLYVYSSSTVSGKDRDTFLGHANELLEAIRLERDGIESRPILFLGHCIGGLLVKQALINAHNNPKYTPIKDATTGLAFFATPHHGTDRSVTTKIATAMGLQKGDDMLKTLKRGSTTSEIMQEQWRHQVRKYQIVSFWGAFDQIVPAQSAQFGLPGDHENVVKLNADHRGVCKFGQTAEDQDNFKLVRGNLKDLYKMALKIGELNHAPVLNAIEQELENADKDNVLNTRLAQLGEVLV